MSNLPSNSLQEGEHNLQEMKTKSPAWSPKDYHMYARLKHVFLLHYLSDSVDFDQTAHIQEQSDLCVHPFLRPINPFGIFFA